MSFELRLAKAKKLAELMETGQQMDDNRHSAPPKQGDYQKSFEERSRDYQAELRAKHMTEEQLDALIEFYESDMGVSIIRAGARIFSEFKETFHARMSTPPPKKGEPGWTLWAGDDRDEADT
jgi:hypothetical protein